MARPTQNPAQKALKELLTSPKVKQRVIAHRKQVIAHRKSLDPPPVPSAAATEGDIQVLCAYLRQNPTYGIPRPILQLMERLRFLSVNIGDDGGTNYFDPDPTWEWLLVGGDGWPNLPLGTRDAAHQALVELVQAWGQELLPGYSVQKTPCMTKILKHSQKPGRKEERSSLAVYGDLGVRLFIFYDMLQDLDRPPNGKFTKEDFNKGSQEKAAAFEARTIKLVQRVHQEFGYTSQFTTGGWIGVPRKILRLPPSIARTIAKQAMGKRTVNERILLYGLLAVYEDRKNGDPKNFKAIRASIYREEIEFPEFIPERFRSPHKK
ncbi:MAG: hypothetical protein O7F12_02960 [Nitrospirae bacterium]|nr:hypothetical protein [Nitrospirota bacterium]